MKDDHLTSQRAFPGQAPTAVVMGAATAVNGVHPSTTLRLLLCALAVLMSAVACAPPPAAARPTITTDTFGVTMTGRPITRFTMSAAGVRVSVITYGGAVTDISVPGRDGRSGPVVLGFPTLHDYETVGARDQLFFGAITGRYANWIAGGHFSLDGRQYELPTTGSPNTLHGGPDGFDKRIWTAQPIPNPDGGVSVRLHRVSPDGEEGFPGTLAVYVDYSLSPRGTLTIHYHATTDQPTVVNLSNHLNFNLAGAGNGTVLGQLLTVDADRYTVLDGAQIPTGQLAPVQGTPFDFRRPTPIGARIADHDDQLGAGGGGYDENWVLTKIGDPREPQHAVHAEDPPTGRTLDVFTTEPGVNVYTGNVLPRVQGIGGSYGRYAAFTTETQHFPDSPNHPQFPPTTLRPGQNYDSTTVFRFGIAP